ncbi:hypothetical protein JVU11DRAFT_2418 [Chiua virens]|nr:hypothetical protein JVU11DRAFT_2418 [Chiua virens]
MAAASEEREMTRYQRGLVDTCFEEGQYQSGIAVLDQLRSSTFKPSADHIRTALPCQGFPHETQTCALQISLSPSARESEAALRLLLSFLVTNSPGSLLRALPRYALDDAADNAQLAESANYGHDDDSLIARESLCIKDCRDCWSILKEGVVQRKKLLPEDTRKKRGRDTYEVDDADLCQDRSMPALVADHAWPILQWLISLFEKDELLHFQKSGGKIQYFAATLRNNTCFATEKFSPLLLSQIPPPRGSTGPRWDAGAPLDIIFHAITQEDGERREMAVRLLTLVRLHNKSDGFGARTGLLQLINLGSLGTLR